MRDDVKGRTDGHGWDLDAGDHGVIGGRPGLDRRGRRGLGGRHNAYKFVSKDRRDIEDCEVSGDLAIGYMSHDNFIRYSQ